MSVYRPSWQTLVVSAVLWALIAGAVAAVAAAVTAWVLP